MNIYKDVAIKEHIESRIEKTVCDICGENVDMRKRGKGCFNADKATIEANIGEIYPGCGIEDCISYNLDCCSKCFIGKMVPLIEQELDCKFQIETPEDGNNNWLKEIMNEGE